jgi:hypothetical protein
MRKSFAAAVGFVLATSGSIAVFAQQGGALNVVAHNADKAPVLNFAVHVRNAGTGELASSTTSNQAGQFSFTDLQPGNYVVAIVDAAGKVVGLSPSISVATGSTMTVTVGATAAGAITAASGSGLSQPSLGTLASVAVANAASAAEVTAVVATRGGKIIVCHKVSATVSQTLKINESEWDSHLSEGDTLGVCPASPSR